MTMHRHPQAERPKDGPGAEPLVRLRGLTRRFGEVAAVDRIDLDIYRGELFSILGASGSGKTTLLRMLAGFDTPSAGSILIDGADMTAVPPYERPVNMMFQSYALFPHMTVEQNVAYGLKKDGVPAAQVRERVAAMLDKVKLGRLAGRKPNALSGGERQRVALARALVKQPKLLLLDEPLAALDKKLRQHTQFELMNLQDELGVTFIVVTHDTRAAWNRWAPRAKSTSTRRTASSRTSSATSTCCRPRWRKQRTAKSCSTARTWADG
ncbi:MAG: ATP-binding cassette domain-containing protein [Xanthomonadales bacterium]|nr:ATP-binding cassette domain-containing protein [Xanthomonadales bacterium]